MTNSKFYFTTSYGKKYQISFIDDNPSYIIRIAETSVSMSPETLALKWIINNKINWINWINGKPPYRPKFITEELAIFCEKLVEKLQNNRIFI